MRTAHWCVPEFIKYYEKVRKLIFKRIVRLRIDRYTFCNSTMVCRSGKFLTKMNGMFLESCFLSNKNNMHKLNDVSVNELNK